MFGSTPFAELRIPNHGSAVASTIGYSLVLSFVVVAICNLVFVRYIPIVAVIASLLWLLLVSWVVVGNIRDEGGVRQYLINRLGVYAGRQFVRATPQHEAKTISFGYSMFGRYLTYLIVDTNAISSIDWSSGQATAMAGRDMSDWHVALWYHYPDGPQKKPFPGVREEEVFIIGPSGPRATAELFGKQLVEFLNCVGVDLFPGCDDREYNTPSRRMAIEPTDER
ncbi:MAG: hypothetical protein U1A77_15585 [Pirellulales bacterium]